MEIPLISSETEKKLTRLLADPSLFLKQCSQDDLIELLRKAKDAYYNTGIPIMPDVVYDRCCCFLESLKPSLPFLSEVRAPVTGTKVRLPQWLGSLTKLRDDDAKFDQKLFKWLPGRDKLMISPKLDGITGLYQVQNGKASLTSGGDGYFGEDLSPMISRIKGFPKTGDLLVRGELIIPTSSWSEISHLGSNPRNKVAGTMRSGTPNPEILGRICFVAFELLSSKVRNSEQLRQLKELGFITVEAWPLESCKLTEEYLRESLQKSHQTSEYGVDGLVVVDDTCYHESINGEDPKHAFAFKSLSTHEQVTVVVKDVVWNPSKDGYLKPLVTFDPIQLSGAQIQRATGFNAKFIQDNGIGPGAEITIIRSGDVIPHITAVVKSVTPSQPRIPYTWNPSQVDYVVIEQHNAEVTKMQMIHFAKTMGFDGVGPGIVEKLFEAGIDTIPKLVKVTVEQILGIPGFQLTSASKIVTSISSAMSKATQVDLMAASGCFGRGLGRKKLDSIISVYPTGNASLEQLTAINGIGEITARSYLEGLDAFREFTKEIDFDIRAPAPVILEIEQSSTPTSLIGQTVVFTGFRDKNLENLIAQMGGRVTTTISGKTTLVVTKDANERSTKIDKARASGIEIISKENFIQKFLNGISGF